MTNTPHIYVADLAAYNNGILHGKWIDATQPIDDIYQQISDMLKNSPLDEVEEWALHDYDNFGNYRLGEYESIETVHSIATFIEENPDLGIELLNHFCGDVEQSEQALEHYQGCYSSLADYAQELTEETTVIPENLTFYINYEAMARDMEMSGDIFTLETAHDEIHIFWGH